MLNQGYKKSNIIGSQQYIKQKRFATTQKYFQALMCFKKLYEMAFPKTIL